MKRDLDSCCVPLAGTIRDALRSLESSRAEIVLAMGEDGRLVGTVTDGDIRRQLLAGASLDSSLEPCAQRAFTSVGPLADRAQVLDLMQARTLRQIPVLNAEGRLLGLHLLKEILGGELRPNWLVIFAGGKGMRLRPITEHVPKPMLSVAGRPILERLILHAVSHGIRRIFLAINYLGHMIEDHFGDGSAFGCQIEYLRETTPLGTGGALGLLPEQPKHPLLVLNGDVVTQVDLGSMLEFHSQGGHMATVGLRDYTHQVAFGCAETADGRILQFEEKPLLRRKVNTGMYVLQPELLQRVVPGVDFPITNLIEDCLGRGESLGAYEVEADWIDVGQREQLRQAREGNSTP